MILKDTIKEKTVKIVRKKCIEHISDGGFLSSVYEELFWHTKEKTQYKNEQNILSDALQEKI